MGYPVREMQGDSSAGGVKKSPQLNCSRCNTLCSASEPGPGQPCYFILNHFAYWLYRAAWADTTFHAPEVFPVTQM